MNPEARKLLNCNTAREIRLDLHFQFASSCATQSFVNGGILTTDTIRCISHAEISAGILQAIANQGLEWSFKIELLRWYPSFP